MTILFNTGGLIVWVAVGTLALYTHNTILPYIYLLYAVAMYVGNRYFGSKAGLFLIGLSWFILALFPAVFLAYYQSWYWLGGYALIVILWKERRKNG